MTNTVVIAFFVDVLAALSSQVGLMLQKLAHRKAEQQQERVLVTAPDLEEESDRNRVAVEDD